MNNLEVLITLNDAYSGCFVEVDLSYSDEIKEKTKQILFAPVNKIVNNYDLSDYMKKS